MAISNHERVGKALELLREGLRPFFERELKAYHGDHWASEVKLVLRDTRFGGGKADAMQDVAVQLVIMDRSWGEVFRKTLGKAERSLVNELLDVRNRWAHQSPFSGDDADRALDSVSRLLTAVSAPQANEVGKMKIELRRLIFGEQVRDEKRTSTGTAIAEARFGRGTVSSQRDRVLDFIARFPGRDDDEIASALKISPRQSVNQICRKLCQEHVLRRDRGERGKLVNFVIADDNLTATASPTKARVKAVSSAMSEDQVKAALVAMLEPKGWSVEVAWGRKRGIDLVALRGAERWVIECKGTGSLAPMQNNYFVGVIGELMQRMSDDRAKHSLAFPDVPKFRRLWSELPAMVKERLQLSALFVSEDGSVLELST